MCVCPTDSRSQEARGLNARPQKPLSPQVGLFWRDRRGGLYFLRQSRRFTAPVTAAFEIAPPGRSRGLKERKTAGVCVCVCLS